MAACLGIVNLIWSDVGAGDWTSSSHHGERGNCRMGVGYCCDLVAGSHVAPMSLWHLVAAARLAPANNNNMTNAMAAGFMACCQRAKELGHRVSTKISTEVL